MLNGVEIRRIGGHKYDDVSVFLHHFLKRFFAMERRVVHNDHRFLIQCGQEILGHPGFENPGIDGFFKRPLSKLRMMVEFLGKFDRKTAVYLGVYYGF